MRRSVRPKSAKGKPRPTPPSQPRPTGVTIGASASQYSRPSASNRYSSRNKQVSQNRSVDLQKDADSQKEQVEQSQAHHPSNFPEVTRPVSSLSKYGVLPRIPSTPGEGNARTSSPVESEFELDLMSSFAQQMILDSTVINHTQPNLTETPPTPVPPKVSSTVPTRRQNNFRNHDSPAHKKSRTNATTRSVFSKTQLPSSKRTSTNTAKNSEPKEGEPRLKLAVKLPDGRRMERYFAPTSSIEDVVLFAQTKMRIPTKDCRVYSMLQVPKVLIRNWKATLEQLELRDRTMLYIEEKD